ncbi:MAG: IclR family transcriptional regulator [Ardenticatenaceae bacterium]
MEKYAGTQAIARVFRLIKLFDDDHPVWSLPDLIEASGLKRTTVFRLLSALEAEGIVRKTPTGEYALGAELILLGGRAIRSNRLRTVAQPYLHQLVHQTSESATIDVLWVDDEQVPHSMVIEELLGQYLLGLFQFIGVRFPAHTTSTGKVLLAYQPEEVLNQLNLAHLTAQTEHTITSPERFKEELAKVRAQGFATTINELEIGLAAVAAPIFNHHGTIQAALCVGGPTSRISKEKLLALSQYVRQNAHHISQKIGYQ